MSFVFFHITVAVYVVSTFVYTAYLVSHNDRFERIAKGILYAGFGAHTATIITRGIEALRTPAAGLHESLTLFAWLTVALFVIVERRYRLSVLGAFVAPFVLTLIITASFLPREIAPLSPVLESYWLPFHIMIAFLGNAFFAIAFMLALMYLIQEHYLKTRKVKGLYFILPSLDVLDELNYRCLTYGFPLLTLAIITGAMWSERAMGSYWLWQPRQIWSLITWFLYAALLHGRLVSGWRGKKAAFFSAIAFIMLLGSFLAINFMSGGAHGYLGD